MVDVTAGRELDALVAEKVMGWTDVRDRKGGKIGLDPLTERFLGVPHFSTEIAAAWRVVERFSGGFVRHRGNEWEAWLNSDPYAVGFTTAADSAPLAICLAALKAVTA